MKFRALLLGASLLLGGFAACGGDDGAGDPAVPASDAGPDATVPVDGSVADASATDASTADVATVVDAASDAITLDASDGAIVDAGDAGTLDAGDNAVYADFTDAGAWTAFDTKSVDAGAAGYWGATFDGRHVYMPSYHNDYGWDGFVTQYDTQGGLSSAAPYSFFDVQSVDPKMGGFYGAGFDGRYVYFVPPASGPSGLVGRYDTQGAFTSAASWSKFDTTTVDAAAKGFVGSVFDGRYLYLVPYYNAITSYSGTVTRYDTQASFTTAGSWSTFDTRTLKASASGFFGGVFDGRYVYFVADGNGTSGTITRYDTQDTFSSSTAWSTFDTTSMNALAKGFQTAAFDGRYLYFVPGHGLAASAYVARYDTTATFGTAGSWKLFDVMTLSAQAKGFGSVAFDGRYVYLVPSVQNLLVRYDTRATFDLAGSWKTFDPTTIDARAKGFEGAVFDGRYLYLVPSYNGGYSGFMMRLDAKSSTGMPNLPAFHGSFL